MVNVYITHFFVVKSKYKLPFLLVHKDCFNMEDKPWMKQKQNIQSFGGFFSQV